MKAIYKLIVFATALLCLNFTPVAAQGISISPTSLSWNATDTSEQPVLVNADYGVTWTVSLYSTSFIVDSSEGEGWDFIHVRPAGVNPGTTDITAVLTVSDGTSSCYLSLTQYGGDPTERIDLDGN